MSCEPGRPSPKTALERNLLERIPGYSLIRGLAGRVAGRPRTKRSRSRSSRSRTRFYQAFIVEEHDDGAFTVFVPSVPTPAAGAVYILPKERVHLVDVPFTKAVSVISKSGFPAHATCAPR